MSVEELKKTCEDKLSDVVKVVGSNKTSVIVTLNEGVTQWDVIEKLKAGNVEIRNYGVYTPSLNDIFVERVGEEEIEEEEKEEEKPAKKKGLFAKGAK